MLLFVGLGNPGRSYAGHRHNIGFMAIEAIVRRYGFGPDRQRFHGLVNEGVLADRKVLALRPMTHMNGSGRAVAAAASFYKLAPADIVVFHDEIDLAPCKMRAKTGGGVAGHNGLRDIAAHLGPDFRRVRIGVGHPGEKHLVHRYVLSDFAKAERPAFAALIDAIAEAAPLLAEGNDSGFATRVALILNPPEHRKRESGAPQDS